MTEIVKKEENLPVEVSHSAWGSENTAASDMIIPKLLLMQALSDLVSKGTATPGDIVDSLTNEVVAKKMVPLEIIPIMTFKTWMRFEMVNNKWEFKEKVPYTMENANWQYETEENGTSIRNDSCLNFFVLLPNDLTGLPKLISFKRSTYHAGKKLSTHFQISGMKNLPPAKKVFQVVSNQTTVDKNMFWTMDVKATRDSTNEELATAYEWWKTLSHAKDHVKVDAAVSEESV